MKGLLLKDIYNMKGQIKIFIILILCYSLYSFVMKDSSMISSILIMVGFMLVFTSLSYDERNKWDKYALTMPVSRKQIVLSKYIFGICSIVGSSLIALVIGLIFTAINSSSYAESSLVCAIMAIYLLFVLFIILPIVFKVGVEKARLIFIIICFAPFIAIIMALNIASPAGLQLPNISLNQLMIIAVIGILVLLILSLYVSYSISVRIYQKREL